MRSSGHDATSIACRIDVRFRSNGGPKTARLFYQHVLATPCCGIRGRPMRRELELRQNRQPLCASVRLVGVVAYSPPRPSHGSWAFARVHTGRARHVTERCVSCAPRAMRRRFAPWCCCPDTFVLFESELRPPCDFRQVGRIAGHRGGIMFYVRGQRIGRHISAHGSWSFASALRRRM